MNQTIKMILVAFVAALLAGGSVYFWQQNESLNSPPVDIQEQEQNKPEIIEETTNTEEWEQIVQYNCKQSGGTFSNNSCECPIEEDLGQTQEMMYDEKTGYCQTTIGGPGGEVMQQMQLSYGRKLDLDACLEELAIYKSE